MQLILAIDADRRQADQLAALVRGRFDAEFVQATSAGEALQVLAERVPDLIMTSPLLSPFDEGVLAEYLREIGLAGAHVQTLRIPVLGVAKPAGRGLFSFGRKRRNESAPTAAIPRSSPTKSPSILHGPPRSARQPTHLRSLLPLFSPTQSHTRRCPRPTCLRMSRSRTRPTLPPRTPSRMNSATRRRFMSHQHRRRVTRRASTNRQSDTKMSGRCSCTVSLTWLRRVTRRASTNRQSDTKMSRCSCTVSLTWLSPRRSHTVTRTTARC